MNDSTPLPSPPYETAKWHGHFKAVEFAPGSPAALGLEFSESDQDAEALVSLGTVDAGQGHPRSPLLTISKHALRLAVMANGGALVALAFAMQSMDTNWNTSMAAAIVLGLGLLLATVSVLAYLNFQSAGAFWSALRTNRAFKPKSTLWLATISGAGSYTALTLAAIWLVPALIGH